MVTLSLIAGPRPAAASCNQIPGAANSFRGDVGSVDRPFARPGDLLTLRLSQVCDAGSPGFAASAAAHVVTVAFRPPAGPANLVVLATDCAALSAEIDACAARPGIDRVACRPLAGDVALRDLDDGRRLDLRFPDTDALVGAVDDDRTLTGPVAIAVSRAGEPLPCGLATAPCAAQPAGLTACVDALRSIDGTCSGAPHETFASFTALPPANDFQALCVDPVGVCSGRGDELRFAVDAAGNVLLPMDWRIDATDEW